ncbi:MAG TPA: hypothetical protein VK327_06150, partial [Candidatus Paceibacterota bacterium]|nr:hypothetical protein [Candidatus Paceibacterota bacterium]
MKSLFKAAFLGAALVAGAAQSHALDGAVVVVNEGVPVTSLSASALKDILNGKTTYWEGGQNVTI